MSKVHSWVRTGLAAGIDAPAVDGRATELRATTEVQLRVTSGAEQVETTPRQIELYGPGDIVAIEPSAIRGVYPQPGTPDAEDNYFAYVEFEAADLPWRYSPASPDGNGQLPPWLALVVVAIDDEGTLAAGLHTDVLATNATFLPPPDELWAWAHAFTDADGVLHSRVMCPRRLEPDTEWLACVVPAFESGRVRALNGAASTDVGPAWGADGEIELPVFHSWRFSTAQSADFRELARRLKPRELPGTIGMRMLDLRDPGPPLEPAEEAVDQFLGAMVSPQLEHKPIDPDVAAWRSAQYLEELNDDPVDSSNPNNYDARRDDPVVRMPKYGAPQRRGEPLRPPEDESGWYSELNLHTRHRSVAAIGASVVRADQEHLVAAAWEHAAALEAANLRLQRARLASETARHTKLKFTALGMQAIEVAGPATGVIDVEGSTIREHLLDAHVPEVVFTGAFRRLGRPAGPLSRFADRRAPVQPDQQTPTISPASMVAGAIAAHGAAPVLQHAQWTAPAGIDFAIRLEIEHVTEASPERPVVVPGELTELRPGGGLGALTPAGVGVEPGIFHHIGTGTLAVATAADTVHQFQQASLASADPAITARADAPELEPRSVRLARGPRRSRRRMVRGTTDQAPASMRRATASRSVGSEPSGRAVTARSVRAEAAPSGGIDPAVLSGGARAGSHGTQIVQVRPRDAVGLTTAPPPPPPPDLGISPLAVVRDAVDPIRMLRADVNQRITVQRPGGQTVEVVGEDADVPPALTARPHFSMPMYERLRNLSVEFLVPGIGLIPDNTVGALSVNNAFVESFLVGANHELSREFRWREYPTQLHHTWFDQFWDVGPDGPPDIGPISEWKPTKLGSHASGGSRLVLLVKGDLIGRYPNLDVYMLEAGEVVHPDTGERIRGAAAGAEPIAPEFTGKLLPGVHFYGFKLPDKSRRKQVTLAQEGGEQGMGYFFVFEEPVRAPRFGLNAATGGGQRVPNWQRLRWDHLAAQGDEVAPFATAAAAPARNPAGQGSAWFSSAATMAEITFRQPTRVLMHATALLEES